MDLPDPDERHFNKVLTAKQQMTASIFTTTARVRDQLLKPANDDGLAKVLEAVRVARAGPVDLFS